MLNELKTIYSLRMRIKLREKGFEPVMELDNPYKPGLKCWVFENSSEFSDALDEVMRGYGYYGKG